MTGKNEATFATITYCYKPGTIKIPAESERGKQQDHKDQEGVTFMHRCPVLN